LCRRVGGPQDRFEQVVKISPPLGIDLRIVHPVVSRTSLFRLTNGICKDSVKGFIGHRLWIYSDLITEYDCLLVYSAVCYDQCPQEPLALIIMVDNTVTFLRLNTKQNTLSQLPSLDAKFSSRIVAHFTRIPDVKIWPYASHKFMAPLIRNLGTEWKYSNSFPSRFRPGKIQLYPLAECVLGLRIYLDGFGEDKIPCPFGIQTLYHSAPSLFAVPTVVFPLPSPIYVNILLRLRVVAGRYLIFFLKQLNYKNDLQLSFAPSSLNNHDRPLVSFI